jgi:hypothetical protein
MIKFVSIGPLLNDERWGHSCGVMNWLNPTTNQAEKIVVAAGGGYLSSVELLYLEKWETNNEGWLIGPSLQNTAGWTAMVEFEGTVILVGGSDVSKEDYSQLLQLSSPEGPWIELEQTLKNARSYHTAFLVPDELVNCH